MTGEKGWGPLSENAPDPFQNSNVMNGNPLFGTRLSRDIPDRDLGKKKFDPGERGVWNGMCWF